MQVTIGGDAAKSCKNTHLLVIMRMRISQKIVLLNLTNRTWFKKGNGDKICTKSVCYYCGMRLMLHTLSIYYGHPNVNLLGVWMSWERRGNYRGSLELCSTIIVSANTKMQLKPGKNIFSLATLFATRFQRPERLRRQGSCSYLLIETILDKNWSPYICAVHFWECMLSKSVSHNFVHTSKTDREI